MGKVDFRLAQYRRWSTDEESPEGEFQSRFEYSSATRSTDSECWSLPRAAQMMIVLSLLLWLGIFYMIWMLI